MLIPILLAGMVQRHLTLTDGVDRLNLGVFVAIAATTGEGQILQRGVATFRDRNGVFADKRLGRVVDRTLAIFAASSRTGNDLLLFGNGDVTSRHKRVGDECLIASLIHPARSAGAGIARSAIAADRQWLAPPDQLTRAVPHAHPARSSHAGVWLAAHRSGFESLRANPD
jgi:hypothetical protein